MFERYTEEARRTLFFARYEASQLGGLSIEPEHILLGLMRDGHGFAGDLFARARMTLADVQRELADRNVGREKLAASVEIPFSAHTKRVLELSKEEADALGTPLRPQPPLRCRTAFRSD